MCTRGLMNNYIFVAKLDLLGDIKIHTWESFWFLDLPSFIQWMELLSCRNLFNHM